MYKRRRTMALMISLVMTFSILISPFSVVQASAPTIKPSTLEIPVIKQPSTLTPTLKEPTISPPIRKETPARAKGVSYKLKAGVEKLPLDIDYNLEQIKLDKFAIFDVDTGIPKEQTFDLDKINGIKYNPGSKFMVVPKNAESAFTPKANRIYIDENEGAAYRVLEVGKADSDGNDQYVVDTPVLTDIFESYTIPKQDIKLTTGNIAYMAPGVVLAPGSGMQRNYVAAAGDNGYISGYKHEGNKHILKLTTNKIIFKYPSKEEEKTKEEKEKAEKEKFEGNWWEKEQNTDLRGFGNEDELKVEVAIKEGTIVIEDPTFHADFDLNWLTTQVKADFYFESKTKADVTFVGDLSFNKAMEACIFGYDIDLGTVLGKEKCNKAFVGIFLVLGANGKVHVEVRTTTTGDARAGYAFKALGYGFIPYSVGPYVTYRPTGFDATFTADGEIHAVLACVPQVGVIIWGTEIGALQIWLGFKADAKFSTSGGGGSGSDVSISAKGSLDLDAFAEMVGYLFGKRYSIFYLDFPIYNGEWDVGAEVSGGAGDLIREAAPSFFVKADASTNIIEGKIVFDTDAKPFANRVYAVEVWNAGQRKETLPGKTDGEGKFISNPKAYNLIPSDKVVVYIPQDEIFEIGNKKYKVIGGRSKEIKVTVPFTSLDFNVDTFNDIITGTVSGKYTGPVDIKVVNIDFSETKYIANAVNGIFSLQIPIDESTYNVWGEINFEGSKFPDNQGVCRTRNLDALDLNFYNDFAAEVNNPKSIRRDSLKNRMTSTIPAIGEKTITKPTDRKTNEDDEGNKVIRPTKIYGTITNRGEMGFVEAQGDDYVRNSGIDDISVQPYTGSVKITSLPIKSAMLDIINKRDHSNLTDPIINSSGWTATTQTQSANFDGKPISAAIFEFIEPDVLAYTIEIEYEGLTKEERYNPFVFHYEKTLQNINEFARQSVQKEITIVTEDKKDAIINPADVMNQWNATWMTQIGRMELTQNGNIVEGIIMQGTTSFPVQGTVTNGIFKGSYLVPSESLFGSDIVTFEMDISTDGSSINFRNIGTGGKLKSLNGTKAIKQ
ncbi:MAG: hypothetical protein PHS15_02735 [Clostridiaceae bacterium]|nr:hypothetical protein [Clostridiaceae bacterium]